MQLLHLPILMIDTSHLFDKFLSVNEDQFIFIIKPLLYYGFIWLAYKATKELTAKVLVTASLKTLYLWIIVIAIYLIAIAASYYFALVVISEDMRIKFARWFFTLLLTTAFGVFVGYGKSKILIKQKQDSDGIQDVTPL